MTSQQQYGFKMRKRTTDVMFALIVLMEKYRAGKTCDNVSLWIKQYDRVPKEELCNCMRKSRVTEKYGRVVQDMHKDRETVVRCAVGVTDGSKVGVGIKVSTRQNTCV